MRYYKTSPIEKSFLNVLNYYPHTGLFPLQVIAEIQHVEKDKGDEAATFILERLVSVGLAKKDGRRYFAV